ncbi:hypothetical protein PHMEG_00020738 [Phytophthora megakarya]|uniref:Reverse transcriptase n=1 Tax=Phytophthora megakarya TaxID=4795 RepID=A0A225VQX3_9STRA|nr:hypothetical protein PHMEG_00020738 [Phytophthora megakarya]
MTVMLGYNQTVQRPRRTVKMKLQIPDFSETCETFTGMPVAEGKDVMLRMEWLRENNPEIDWERWLLRPRTTTREPPLQLVLPKRHPARMIGGRHFKNARQDREIMHCYRQHGHLGAFGETKIISSKLFLKDLRKGKDVKAVFAVKAHDSEKVERFKQQGWDGLVDNPAYDVLVRYRDTVFCTELPSSTPPVREGIEHEIQLHPGTQPISVKQWRQSPEQHKVIQDWTKEMVQTGIIRPSTSAFCAPTFCVKKPVGWRIVHDYRQLNSATVLPAIPMLRKEDTFDAMGGSYCFSCMDLLWNTIKSNYVNQLFHLPRFRPLTVSLSILSHQWMLVVTMARLTVCYSLFSVTCVMSCAYTLMAFPRSRYPEAHRRSGSSAYALPRTTIV